MTQPAERQEARVPMLKPNELPELYRLLAVFSGIPMKTLPALEAAGLRVPGDTSEILEQHRALLRLLTQQARVRWVHWGPEGVGYVLTGHGETALEVYVNRYGPTHPPRRTIPLGVLARHRLRVKQGLEEPDPDIDPDVPRQPVQERDQ